MAEPALNRVATTERPSKLGEQVAARIEREIMDAGWPVGQMIGSEPELLERHQVSRAVFREAVRLLEHHGTARMRRGPGGGLIVQKPDTHAVMKSVAIFLDSEHVTADQLFEARMGIELIAVQLAAERIDEDGIQQLRHVLEGEQEAIRTNAPYSDDDVHTALARLANNPAIALFTRTLTELERGFFGTVSPQRRGQLRACFYEDHAAIVDAVVAGDGAVARHRLQRHLKDVAAKLHRH